MKSQYERRRMKAVVAEEGSLETDDSGNLVCITPVVATNYDIQQDGSLRPAAAKFNVETWGDLADKAAHIPAGSEVHIAGCFVTSREAGAKGDLAVEFFKATEFTQLHEERQQKLDRKFYGIASDEASR